MNAQWKVSSVAKAEPYTKLLQVIDAENTTLVYATISRTCNETHLSNLSRKTYVKANGMKYKIVNSVNLPLSDDADQRFASFSVGENEVNFVMEFEKFPAEGGFDIIENNDDAEWHYNFHDVTVSRIDASEVIDTKRFLDSGAPVIAGKYAEEGSFFLYYIRDGLCVTCNAVKYGGGLTREDEIFYVDIVNNSDHGVMFDFDKVTVAGEKTKANGTVESKEWPKYTPESYEQYVKNLDAEEARYNSSGILDLVGTKLDFDKYRTTQFGTWERLGYDALGVLNEKAIHNRVSDYMKEHPKEHPSALRSTSIKSGESIHGYIAAKKKKADSAVITIPLDGHAFDFTFTL